MNRRLFMLAVVFSLVVDSPTAWSGPAEDQFAVAAGHYSKQRWRLADEEFRDFLAKYPDHRDAATAEFFRAESLVQLKRLNEAVEALDRFLADHPDHSFAATAVFRRGEVAYLTNDDETARRRLTEFLRLRPRDPLNGFVLAYLGEIALRGDDNEGARKYFTEALSAHPQGALTPQCRLGLGRALERGGDRDAALEQYEQLSRGSDETLADDALLEMGAMRIEHGQFEEGLTALKDLTRRFPDSPLLPHAGYWTGMAQLGQKQYSLAAATFQQVRKAYAEHRLAPALTFAAAEARDKEGDPDAAVQLYEEVGRRWPDSAWGDDSLQSRVRLALERDQHIEVDRLAAEFAERYADSELLPLVRQSLGRCRLKERRFDDAAQLFEKLAQSDEPAGLRRVANRYYLALAYLGQSRDSDALRLLEDPALEDVPESLAAGVLAAKATALCRTERYTDAIPLLRDYVDRFESAADAAKCRGQLVLAMAHENRFSEARDQFESYCRAFPEDEALLPTARRLAEMAERAGEAETAARLFQYLASEGHPSEYVLDGLFFIGLSKSDEDPAAAAEVYRRIVTEYPDSERRLEAESLLAKTLREADRVDEAIEVYRGIAERLPDSREAVAALRQVARLHQDAKRNEDALRVLEQICRDLADQDGLDAVLHERAWLLVDLGRNEQADAVLEELVGRFSESRFRAHALYRLAESAMRRREFDRANELLDGLKVETDDPNLRGHASYLRGQVAANQFRWGDVVEPMRQVLESVSDQNLRFAASYWIAEALYRQGLHDQAAEAFDRLRTESEGRQEDWTAMVPLRRAQLLAHQGNWDEARTLAESIGDRFSGFRQQYEVDYLLGRCLAAKADFSAARAAFEKVIGSSFGQGTETAAMAQWMIGETYFQQKDYDQAIKAYHRVEVLHQFPQWQSAALLQAGKCHERKGETREAIKLYRQLIDEHPNSKYVDDASRRTEAARKRLAEDEKAES